jgi:hypothetical protein
MASETRALAKIESSLDLLSIEEIKYFREQVQQLLRDVMVEGIDNDYAIIPGTKKKSLLKPGAEKICSMFRFVVEPMVEEMRDGVDVTYRVFVRLSAPNGRFLGSGVGECSTKESKYAWREAVCEAEWESADPASRRIHWKRDYKEGAISVLQVRENPADKSNTVLKMGKKRSLVDGVLTVTGCSDIFTQDLEEDEEGGRQNAVGGAQQGQQKKQGAGNGPTISGPQSGRFYGIWKKAGRDPKEVGVYLKRICKVDDSRKMHPDYYDEACRWAATQEPVPAAPAAQATTGQSTSTASPAAEAKREPSQEEAESATAFGVLGWDEKTRERFAEQYHHDWKKILGELKILVTKREQKENS